jgi:HAMP domain-containing protein
MPLMSLVQSRLGLNIAVKLALVLAVITAGAAIWMNTLQSSRMDAMIREKARLAATVGARQYGATLDEAIDSGLLTVADVFDQDYVEVKGYTWGPHQKYHTRYDFFTDQGVLVFQDRYLDDQDFVYAVGMDENGYVPTHNSAFSRPLTGDFERDVSANRTKRKFEDLVALTAAHNASQATLVQEYRPDASAVEILDVSAPILVKGRHWGAFRVGLSKERVAGHARDLLMTLVGIFAALGLVALGVMYALLSRAMKPVEALTAAADRISLGEELETPLKATTSDEIGQLTRAIDRLRASMRAAMERLGE